MKYNNLKELKSEYESNTNIINYIKDLDGLKNNSIKSIEISYDLQAGSYIDFFEKNKIKINIYTDEISEILSEYILPEDKILDCGTGEMTTLSSVANKSFESALGIYCFDLSVSRLMLGRAWSKNVLSSSLLDRVHSFIGEFTKIPLLDNSMDIVWTSHALEPNHGREEEMLSEILRVAKRKVILFEPSYERNTVDGKKRMKELGYVQGLEAHIEHLGGTVEDVVEIISKTNPLNPTYAYIITPPILKNIEATSVMDSVYACPNTGAPLLRHELDFFYSKESLLAYPVIAKIPILRAELAIIACHADKYI